MLTNEIRQHFLRFFSERGHTVVPSSSLIPANDKTLLFTNAGMIQFKDVFLGSERRRYSRAVSAQCCVRAGGKHNDLENVGYTARHHTLFEMLGNFSFGDYFKREAIAYAWEFLTQVLKLPPERLWVTVFRDDAETATIWLDEMKVSPQRFSYCDEKDNFWAMGETGPCGPCTEIFYDHGPQITGGPPGSPDQEGDRYVEIWNLVFMQYDRALDGRLTPLPKPCVDTGMGLERIAAVMQNTADNYQTDIFQAIIQAIANKAGVNWQGQAALKVIADHLRTACFLVAEGILPSNEGRGYVLRRIIRRAVRFGYQLGLIDPFLSQLVVVVLDKMGEVYPLLREKQLLIEKTLLKEEQQFSITVKQGMHLLEKVLSALGSDAILSGEVIFQLYDTYGFPVDLTRDVAKEKGIELDEAGFQQCMAEQRHRSQQEKAFSFRYQANLSNIPPTDFVGYEESACESMILQLLNEKGESVTSLKEGEVGQVMVNKTPFYAEAGGQVGDTGVCTSESGHFSIQDTQKHGLIYGHIGKVTLGALCVGQVVQLTIDTLRRKAIRAHHSATHLLHAALKQILGPEVMQKGSRVECDRLRLDFSADRPVTLEQIHQIECLVNEWILTNAEVATEIVSQEQAKQRGAVALFGEKYGEIVRTLQMGTFSYELCGGTHVARLGDIGLFKILSEGSIAAGIRRLEACTGLAAVKWVHSLESGMAEMASLLQVGRLEVSARVKQVLAQLKAQEKSLEAWTIREAQDAARKALAGSIQLGDLTVIITQLPDMNSKSLKIAADYLKTSASIVLLSSCWEGKVNLITTSQVAEVPAGEWLLTVAEKLGGKAGGKSDFAQGAGINLPALPRALEEALVWVRARLDQRIDEVR